MESRLFLQLSFLCRTLPGEFVLHACTLALHQYGLNVAGDKFISGDQDLRARLIRTGFRARFLDALHRHGANSISPSEEEQEEFREVLKRIAEEELKRIANVDFRRIGDGLTRQYQQRMEEVLERMKTRAINTSLTLGQFVNVLRECHQLVNELHGYRSMVVGWPSGDTPRLVATGQSIELEFDIDPTMPVAKLVHFLDALDQQIRSIGGRFEVNRPIEEPVAELPHG